MSFVACRETFLNSLHIILTSSKEKGIKKEWNQDD